MLYSVISVGAHLSSGCGLCCDGIYATLAPPTGPPHPRHGHAPAHGAGVLHGDWHRYGVLAGLTTHKFGRIL